MEDFVTGKHLLITGCTAGIGRAMAIKLARSKPAKMILVARSEAKAQKLQAKLKTLRVKTSIVIGDFSKPRDVFRIAAEVNKSGEPLHLIVSNAGIWHMKPKRVLQEDDLELHFATNYLSMVILCRELAPLLEKSGPSRIIITGSFTGWSIVGGKADLNNLQGQLATTKKATNDIVYAQSKLLQHMWAKKFASTLTNVTLLVFDPGYVVTDIERLSRVKKLGPIWSIAKLVMGFRSPEQGAVPGVWGCTSEEITRAQNGFYLDWKVSGKPKKSPPVELGYYPNYNAKSESIMDKAQVDKLWNATNQIYDKLKAKYSS